MQTLDKANLSDAPALDAIEALRLKFAAGIARYDRERSLPYLMNITAFDLADYGEDMTRRIIARLERLIESQTRAGTAGHWTYCAHHLDSLRQAISAERAHLDEMGSTRGGMKLVAMIIIVDLIAVGGAITLAVTTFA